MKLYKIQTKYGDFVWINIDQITLIEQSDRDESIALRFSDNRQIDMDIVAGNVLIDKIMSGLV